MHRLMTVGLLSALVITALPGIAYADGQRSYRGHERVEWHHRGPAHGKWRVPRHYRGYGHRNGYRNYGRGRGYFYRPPRSRAWHWRGYPPPVRYRHRRHR